MQSPYLYGNVVIDGGKYDECGYCINVCHVGAISLKIKTEDIMYVVSRKTTGYKKLQKGLACEDFVLTKEFKDFVIMACADGHGDRKCKYAAKGAELATWVITKVLQDMRKVEGSIEDYGVALNDSREEIIKRFICSWVGAVLDDYKVNHPEDTAFQQAFKELSKYAKCIYDVRSGEMPVREFRALAEYRHKREEAIYKITLLYGTTMNAMVITDKFVFAIGIGDGDVIAVNGKRVEWLLPQSPQFDTSPASLCGKFGTMPDNFTTIYVPITKGRKLTDSYFQPEIIMIATDGLRNAFLSDDAFAEKLLDIATAFKKGERQQFVKNSKKWIMERSEYGTTQDDIAFCLYTKYSGKPRRKATLTKKDKSNA